MTGSFGGCIGYLPLKQVLGRVYNLQSEPVDGSSRFGPPWTGIRSNVNPLLVKCWSGFDQALIRLSVGILKYIQP